MQAIVAHAANDIRIEDCQAQDPTDSEVQIQIERGGICGSDLHYVQHGGFGSVRLREPMILGHEVAGKIIKVGDNTAPFEIGQRVAVSPSVPCTNCEYCLQGIPNHCHEMLFYGSAMRFPHVQGAFRDVITVHKTQCANAQSLSSAEAAMAEPLAVTIHAARQAGNLVGKRVLVTGCGPIGLLCILVAQNAGAKEIVATDITDFPLQTAKLIGADVVVNVGNSDSKSPLENWHAGKGYFDVQFECTGVAAALAQSIPTLKPRGIIVQLGLGGNMDLPVQQMTAKELQLRGSFRFHEEFFTGIEWMQRKRIDVKQLITHSMPMAQADAAFKLAADRSQALKVQLEFG